MIAIDIPMPKTCYGCRFFAGATHPCVIKPTLKIKSADRFMRGWISAHRHPDCPLLEVDHIRDKTELSLYDVYEINEEVLSASVKDIHAKRLGEFIFSHPDLIRKDYSDDLDSYVRNFAVDCFVVKINKKKEE